jgi:hypothetical protein
VSLGSRVAAGAGRGAAYGGLGGAVQGFAEGEGGLENRLEGARDGAVLGALAGTALGSAVPVLSSAVRRATDGARERAQDTVLRGLDMDRLTPEQVAREYQARNAIPGTTNPLVDARPELASDMRPGSNTELMLMNALQQPSTNRADTVARLSARVDSQTDRILSDFEDIYQTRRGTMDGSYQQLAARRSADAAPLYDEAYSDASGQFRRLDVSDPTFRSLVARIPPQAWDEGAAIARTRGHRALIERPVSYDTLFDLDYAKRGLDDIISAGTDISGRMNARAAAAADLRADLLGYLDNAVPEFAAARAAWAGPTAAMDAMKFGQSVFGQRGPAVERRVSQMVQSEREAFLIGVLDALQRRVGGVNDSRNTAATLKNENFREIVRASMRAVTNDPAEAERLVERITRNIDREDNIAKSTNKVLHGSQTAIREAVRQTDKHMDSVMYGVLAELAFPGGAGLAVAGGNQLRKMLQRRLERSNIERQGEVARLLGGTDSYEVTTNMREVAARRDELLNALRRQRMNPLVLGVTGKTAASDRDQ